MPALSPNRITLCTLQPAITWDQPERTFDRIAAMLAQAVAESPIDIAVLPEHFNAVAPGEEDTGRGASALAFAAQLARRHELNLVAGSVEYREPGTGDRVNSAFVFNRAGQVVGRYDKRKLFGFEKHRNVRPGKGPLIVTLDGVRCGVLICADLWYPELLREIANGIEVLFVPAQTTIRPEAEPGYARRLWYSLAMTRAQENVLALAVSDQATSSQAPYRCGGVSSLTDPSAEPDLQAIQRVVDRGLEGYLLATVDRQRLMRFRRYRQQNGLLPT